MFFKCVTVIVMVVAYLSLIVSAVEVPLGRDGVEQGLVVLAKLGDYVPEIRDKPGRRSTGSKKWKHPVIILSNRPDANDEVRIVAMTYLPPPTPILSLRRSMGWLPDDTRASDGKSSQVLVGKTYPIDYHKLFKVVARPGEKVPEDHMGILKKDINAWLPASVPSLSIIYSTFTRPNVPKFCPDLK